MSFNMYVPTRIVFGEGAAKSIHEQALPGKKALIVISNGKSTRDHGYLALLEGQLKQAGVAAVVFDEIQPNPLQSTVMKGAAVAKQNGCDVVIALGGGSVMDAAKAIAFMATHPGELWDYISSGTGKALPMKNKPLPIVCVTTTAGTGSEADPWGVITNDETHEKIGFGGWDELFPVLSIVDPALMASVPPRLTAYQGFDALFHATESYISKFANLMSDMYALTSIENVAEYLPRAVKDGGDAAARERMAFANTLSGIVMTVSETTAEHSIEHAMSAYHQDLPHGAGLIMISRAFYEFFVERHACDARFICMARAMGVERADKPEDFIAALVDLQRACGVADLKMSDYGIAPDEFEKIAKNARETMGGLYDANPCELTDADVVEILRKSYK